MRVASYIAMMALSVPALAQPTQPVRLSAEWEPALGTLIRWPLGIPMDLVWELAEEDSLYVLVENASQQSQALSTFQAWGVNTDHCRFIIADTWSHWTRDWGPHWTFDGNGDLGITDPVFEGYPWIPGGPYREYTDSRGYEEDDLVNQVLAAEFGCPIHAFPAYLTGGNFMTDGHGTGFSTLAMLTENEAFWTHAQFIGMSSQWLGLDEYFITVNPEDYGIQHIDCAAKLLDEETLIIKQVDPSHPDYSRLETFCDQLTTAISCYGREYEIHRVLCGSYSGNEVAAYTNSYILNGKVFVPMFGISTDPQAISTYQEAMPGYEIIGVPYSEWYYYDALHCRTREVMDPGMLLIWHRPLSPETEASPAFPVETEIRCYSGEGLVPEATELVWRADQGPWEATGLQPVSGDSLSADIPGYPPGTVIDYYLTAADSSGRVETLPRTAPEGYYSFEIVSASSSEGTVSPAFGTAGVSPNPASLAAVFSWVPDMTVTVHSIDGRCVLERYSPEKDLWIDLSGLPVGCYTIQAMRGSSRSCCRLVVAR